MRHLRISNTWTRALRHHLKVPCITYICHEEYRVGVLVTMRGRVTGRCFLGRPHGLFSLMYYRDIIGFLLIIHNEVIQVFSRDCQPLDWTTKGPAFYCCSYFGDTTSGFGASNLPHPRNRRTL
jgi:hypothetical protein